VSTAARSTRHRRDDAGQALVEFAFAIIPFLLMVIALFDLGRAVYTYNGLAEATREIARVTAVYPGITLGTTTQTADRVAVQRALVPGMSNPTYECVDVAGNATGHTPCRSGDYVRVSLSATYTPVSMLGLGGPITLNSSASIRIP
jgi:Flp pilus assembly protein TadG